MDSTSHSLLLRLRQPGQELAWRRFVELYAPLIYYWVRGRGLSPDDSADIVQDVLTRIVRALPEFRYDPNQRFRGWLRSVTTNSTNDFFRKQQRRADRHTNASFSNVAVANSVDLFEEAEYRDFLLQRALRLMKTDFTEEVWQACWKLVVDGKKAGDVALELGISRNAVYLAKSRVLKRLREELAGLFD